jgi:hypothetical protein
MQNFFKINGTTITTQKERAPIIDALVAARMRINFCDGQTPKRALPGAECRSPGEIAAASSRAAPKAQTQIITRRHSNAYRRVVPESG